VELQDQILPPFDKEMTTPIARTLADHGVELILGDSAESLEATADGIAVHLKSGKSIAAQLVVLGVGVRPENKLAVDAGLDVGPRGGIRVSDRLQTSDPNIYAVGDAIEVQDVVTNSATQIPLAGPANRQGRIAADNVFGRASRYRGTQGTAIVRVFDRTAAMTGASEKTLRRAGREFRKIYIHPANHATYYPGAERMSLKLLFAPGDGKILGAQAVGGAGVDKRIDVVAVAIQAGMTVFDLEEMELCYSPQYGSAKDPINMAGFVAASVVRGDTKIVHVADLPGTAVLDVRTRGEFDCGHIPGAVNISVDELRERLGEVDRGQRTIVYCQFGQRGYLAARILSQAGYDVANLSGGYMTYCQTTTGDVRDAASEQRPTIENQETAASAVLLHDS
jgi:rhodanese-related sulfurtransferase